MDVVVDGYPYPVDALCGYVTWPRTLESPEEYCAEPCEDGEEWCADHNPDNWQPDWDDLRKDRMCDCE